MNITEHDALVVVDVQNDYCPGGAVAVPGGDDVIDVINWLMPNFHHVIATQDFHPPGHSSFVEQGGPWPEHCVRETLGAEFHPGLNIAKIDDVVQKGTDLDVDGHSGFAGTDLADRLREMDVTRVFVTGLATDYGVRETVFEAIENGFDAVLVVDAVAAVDTGVADGERAIGEMRKAGATLASSDEINS